MEHPSDLTEEQKELRILYDYDILAEGDMFPELFDEAFKIENKKRMERLEKYINKGKALYHEIIGKEEWERVIGNKTI